MFVHSKKSAYMSALLSQHTLRSSILSALSPSSISSLMMAFGEDLSSKEKSVYLDPRRDFPEYYDWIVGRESMGDRIALVGRDTTELLERIHNPEVYWQKEHPKRYFDIWMVAVPWESYIKSHTTVYVNVDTYELSPTRKDRDMLEERYTSLQTSGGLHSELTRHMLYGDVGIDEYVWRMSKWTTRSTSFVKLPRLEAAMYPSALEGSRYSYAPTPPLRYQGWNVAGSCIESKIRIHEFHNTSIGPTGSTLSTTPAAVTHWMDRPDIECGTGRVGEEVSVPYILLLPELDYRVSVSTEWTTQRDYPTVLFKGYAKNRGRFVLHIVME